jgi:hypothetical protein
MVFAFIYGGFHKWRYPHSWMVSGKSIYKWMIEGYPYDLGTPHVFLLWPLWGTPLIFLEFWLGEVISPRYPRHVGNTGIYPNIKIQYKIQYIYIDSHYITYILHIYYIYIYIMIYIADMYLYIQIKDDNSSNLQIRNFPTAPHVWFQAPREPRHPQVRWKATQPSNTCCEALITKPSLWRLGGTP